MPAGGEISFPSAGIDIFKCENKRSLAEDEKINVVTLKSIKIER